MMAPRIGFIGLGIMGKPMARNLVRAGFRVTVHNRSRAKVEELVQDGASRAASPREAASAADIVITMLPNSPDVELVALGDGGITKLANQIIVAVNLTAIGEALVFGAKAGVDPQKMIRALAGGLAGSKCLDQKSEKILTGDFAPGFKIDLHFKDLNLIHEAARSVGVPIPTAALVEQLFAALRIRGRGGLDHSGVITLFEDLAGVQVRRGDQAGGPDAKERQS